MREYERDEKLKDELKRAARAEAGFTLVELIVVLVILALLTGVLGMNVYKRLRQGRDQIAKIAISNLDQALMMYSLDTGNFPSSAEGLQALLQNPTGGDTWNGPYLKKAGDINDPWGKTYIYKSPGDHGDYDICSAGADGEEGNEDDICNWQ